MSDRLWYSSPRNLATTTHERKKGNPEANPPNAWVGSFSGLRIGGRTGNTSLKEGGGFPCRLFNRADPGGTENKSRPADKRNLGVSHTPPRVTALQVQTTWGERMGGAFIPKIWSDHLSRDSRGCQSSRGGELSSRRIRGPQPNVQQLDQELRSGINKKKYTRGVHSTPME